MSRTCGPRDIISLVIPRIGDNNTFRESKRPRLYSNYVALVSNIIDAEPSNYEEAIEKKVWKDAMIEEYQSIMKNDVWDIVPRPK
jgi:hypothetical protein